MSEPDFSRVTRTTDWRPLMEKVETFFRDYQVRIFIETLWSDQNPNYRQHLQCEIERVSTAESNVSVSHCPMAGGFALTLSREFIGFDLEVASRVRPTLARRICQTEEEFRSAPDAAALWASKEAAYKSLRGFQQPEVISQIEIGRWQRLSQCETYQVVAIKGESFGRGLGAVFEHAGLKLGLYVVRSQL
jgi:hypothetical protein